MLRRTSANRSAVFTEQSPVLTQIAKSLKLKSNLWVESWMVSSSSGSKMFNITAKDGQVPTKCSIWKYFELYNRDQVSTAGESVLTDADYPLTSHISYSTKKPYGKLLSFDMEALSKKHSYQSKVWIPVSKMQTKWKPDSEFVALDKEKPHKFYITSNVELYSVDMLEGDVNHVKTTPISASTRRFYPKSELTATLNEFSTEHGFNSGLFFTKGQMETAKLVTKPDAKPCVIKNGDGGGNFNAYNIEQMDNYENILANLGRYGTPEKPIFLFSGIDVRTPSIIAAQERFTQKYWISHREVEENNWQMKDGEESKGTSMTTYDKQIEYFNVCQLDNPEAGFMRAGLLDMVSRE